MANVFQLHNKGKALTARQRRFIEAYSYTNKDVELRQLELHYMGSFNMYNIDTYQEQTEIAWFLHENPEENYR